MEENPESHRMRQNSALVNKQQLTNLLTSDSSNSRTLCRIVWRGGLGVTKSFFKVDFLPPVLTGFCSVLDVNFTALTDLETLVLETLGVGLAGVGLVLVDRRGVGAAMTAFLALYSLRMSAQSTRFSSGSQLSSFGPYFFQRILYSVLLPLRVRSARIV